MKIVKPRQCADSHVGEEGGEEFSRHFFPHVMYQTLCLLPLYLWSWAVIIHSIRMPRTCKKARSRTSPLRREQGRKEVDRRREGLAGWIVCEASQEIGLLLGGRTVASNATRGMTIAVQSMDGATVYRTFSGRVQTGRYVVLPAVIHRPSRSRVGPA
jgi:hypothetical protein